MSTERQIRANRLNAKKSTGPQTLEGKATSSKNAVKHGLLSSEPVLLGVERVEDWNAHRSGIFESLKPVGYLQEVLTDSVALFLWRLRRIPRYETGVAEARIAAAKMEVATRHENDWPPIDLAADRIMIDMADLAIRTLENISRMPAEGKVDTRDAVCAHSAISRVLPETLQGIRVEGVPDNDMDYENFDNWTWGLLQRCLLVFADAARMDPETLRKEAILEEWKRRRDHEESERAAKEKQRLLELEVALEVQERMLLEPSVLAKVARYEATLERGFFGALTSSKGYRGSKPREQADVLPLARL